jgi:hypothetical protein
MSTLITLENCPDCNVEVSQQHSAECTVETCKNCGLNRKRTDGCKCENYSPMSLVWNGQITTKPNFLFPIVAWSVLFKIQESVNVELEKLRQEKVIGKGIEAAAVVDVSPVIRRMIELFPSDLAEFFGVSEFTFGHHTNNTQVIVSVMSLKGHFKKCDRCFRYQNSVGIHDYWPTYNLCSRCVEVLLEIKWPPFIVNPETKDCYVCKDELEWHTIKTQ